MKQKVATFFPWATSVSATPAAPHFENTFPDAPSQGGFFDTIPSAPKPTLQSDHYEMGPGASDKD
jgi:hypothetical protein